MGAMRDVTFRLWHVSIARSRHAQHLGDRVPHARTEPLFALLKGNESNDAQVQEGGGGEMMVRVANDRQWTGSRLAPVLNDDDEDRSIRELQGIAPQDAPHESRGVVNLLQREYQAMITI